MKKMTLVGLKDNMDDIIDTLHKSGSVQIIEITEEEDNASFYQKGLSDIEDRLNEYKFAIDLLKSFNPHKKGMFEQKPLINDETFNEHLKDELKYLDDIKNLHHLEEKQNELNNEKARLEGRIEVLTPWKDIGIALRRLGKGKYATIKLGTIETKNLPDFQKGAEELTYFGYEELKRVKNTVFMAISYLNNLEESANNLLMQSGFSALADEGSGTPEEIINSLNKRINAINENLAEVETNIKDIDKDWEAFTALYDYYYIQKEKFEKYDDLLMTRKTFCLQGWVPETYCEQVKDSVESTSPYCYVEFKDPAEEDNPPTLLKNNAFVTPFELITELFSLPHKGEIDPNPIMAPFFFVFFGIMLGDVGYGIALSVLMWLGERLIKPSGQGKKLMDLLLLCGISSAIWGAVFGGWFGDLFGIPALWFNPLNDPMTMLVFSLALGVIQIFTGLGMKAYINVKNGHVIDAIFDQGFWLVFLTGLLMLAIPNFRNIAAIVALIGALGLVLTQGRSKSGVIMKFLSGLVSLYGLSGYLSDVLSYSRLLALCLSGSVIAMVMNTLARMFGGGVLGFIIGLIILIVGHVFNLAISGLGCYVHSSRLQYVEFYGKFYEGGGKPFNPFKLSLKYYNYQ
ncbi:MAG: V-type ATP synthase subunit I [Thermoanaerobacteraceae bacterium]|nr:V-type ATP synthase subunit I [Thermoanaerobacteraceae bacterium]